MYIYASLWGTRQQGSKNTKLDLFHYYTSTELTVIFMLAVEYIL
jgi:hypothetical protein